MNRFSASFCCLVGVTDSSTSNHTSSYQAIARLNYKIKMMMMMMCGASRLLMSSFIVVESCWNSRMASSSIDKNGWVYNRPRFCHFSI
jgi:hypothetical protein